MSDGTPQDCVRRGIELLDEMCPDWVSKIDLSMFNINTYSRCVLGQIFGGYRAGKQQLGITLTSGPAYYGFDAHPRGTDAVKQEFALLQEIWESEIVVRKAQNRRQK